jgi:hypothetical protein
MLYHVTRNGQSYGPYTLEDLSRYVASGNIQLTDMAKSDEMAEWVTVASLVNAEASVPPPQAPYAPVQPAYAAPAYPAVGEAPPNMNWVLVLVLSFFTCSIFMFVWNLILAAWVNRIAPASKVLILYIAVTVGWLVLSIAGKHYNVHYGSYAHAQFHAESASFSLLWIAWWVLKLFARFTMRNELERYYNTVEPIGLRLSGVMTFFFGGLYFQYHLNRITEMKRAMAYGAPRL